MFVAAGGVTLYIGIYGGHTALDDRLNDDSGHDGLTGHVSRQHSEQDDAASSVQ